MRSMLLYQDAPSPHMAAQANLRLDRIQDAMRSMSVQDGQKIADMVTQGAEDVRLYPERERRRLGMSQERPVTGARHKGMGDLVVTTAVRATVWESVRAILRALFR